MHRTTETAHEQPIIDSRCANQTKVSNRTLLRDAIKRGAYGLMAAAIRAPK
jgi:hypothetical protein